MVSAQKKDNRILVPGGNCWKLEEADQLSFLIDADAYFFAFRESAKLARKNIYICGWDIDSRMLLQREDPHDGYPLDLGEFLTALVRENEDLHIYIMIWDFVRFMGLEREWFSRLKLEWNAHENIHFSLDQEFPVGASIHHKLVVIDDAISFVGGLDLTKKRWDTPSHRPEDSRRRTFDGESYRPHHDVQIMVSGKPSQILGSYARDRWKIVTGRKLEVNEPVQADTVWPDTIEADMTSCTVGISRTQAEYEDLPGIYEVEKLYLDSIEKARDYMYIENQYFTATKITDALIDNLCRKDGPEIVIVLPFSTDGWLSQNTMDMLRTRVVRKLREVDKFNRLGIYYAHQDGLEGDETIKIHAKVMIIDDRFARVASSNLNNRSMGFDTECDLSVEVDHNSGKTRAIREFLDALLAEQLGVTARDVRKTLEEKGSLLKTIQHLRGNSRSLEDLDGNESDTVEYVADGQNIFDPERPIGSQRFLKFLLPVADIPKNRLKYMQLALFMLVVIGMAAAWRYSPLEEFVAPEKLKELADTINRTNLSWLYVLTAYALGSVLVVPITLLITLTILIFGAYKGFVFALLGSLISGTVTYWLGRVLGRDTVRSIAGNKINKISKKLGKSGIMSTFFIRLMPIAPYSVVNIVAGASHIRFRDFFIGTFLGMIPGSLAIAGIIDRGYALIKNPNAITIISTVGVIGVVVGTAFFLRKKIQE